MSFHVAELPEKLPDGCSVNHYPIPGTDGPEWESVLLWENLFIDKVRGFNRGVNFYRLMRRVFHTNNN